MPAPATARRDSPAGDGAARAAIGRALISRHSTQPDLLVDRRQTHTCPNLVQRHQLGRRRGKSRVRASPAVTRFTWRRGTYFFLKTSLSFSPTSLRSDSTWSRLPSFSVLLSPVTLPTDSLALPPSSWSLFFALSTLLTVSVYSYFAGNRLLCGESTQGGRNLSPRVTREPVVNQRISSIGPPRSRRFLSTSYATRRPSSSGSCCCPPSRTMVPTPPAASSAVSSRPTTGQGVYSP